MIDYSDIPEYGNTRLRGSVCLVKGIPRYIDRITSKKVRFSPLGSGMGNVYDETDLKHLDTTPIRLGFVNALEDTLYLARIPFRQWKQGCRPDNLTNLMGTGYNTGVSWKQLSYLYECHKGIYPSLSTCMERVDCLEYKRQAFSRHYAVGEKQLNGFNLYRQNKKVGIIDLTYSGQPTFQLDQKFGFLQEEVTENLNGH